MANEVMFNIPSKPLGKADVEFTVWQNRMMHGTLKVSKGTLVWFPSKTKKGYRVGWAEFNDLMVNYATSFERR